MMCTKLLRQLTAAAAVVAGLIIPAEVSVAMPLLLPDMPEGYHLLYFDDCGQASRQPHIRALDAALFSPSVVNGDEHARTVAWAWKEVLAVYEGLDVSHPYIAAITYSNEVFNDRVQSLHAGDVELHGARPLPKGGSERLLFRIPPEAISDGTLTLRFSLDSGPNAVVSCVELWTDLPSPPEVHIDSVMALYGPLRGLVLSKTYEPLAGARVTLGGARGLETPGTTTGDDGTFEFTDDAADTAAAGGDLAITAQWYEVTTTVRVPRDQLEFEPVRYRPIPVDVTGTFEHVRCLDGEWRMRFPASDSVRHTALGAEGWLPVNVPGQWVQQGHDIDPKTPVAMATEFDVPAEWAGSRIFLRFDAIHAGTDYYVNGALIGHSDRLFTPVEWEVTDAVQPGQANRLDLEMVVDTLSERMSYSSGYAFHNLGGIDRSVRLYALPKTHIASLAVSADLDADCRDATLGLRLGIDSDLRKPEADLRLEVSLVDDEGDSVFDSRQRVGIGPIGTGGSEHRFTFDVPGPRKWSAEKPNLYRLRVRLMAGHRALETVEREIGFRRIEVRGSQLYVNGAKVKLAGACRHEIDPVTGRADTMRHAEEDVRLMKAANLNTIRTSHYPPTDELLAAADRIGMYVEVEAPFCWVGGDDDPDHLRAVLDPTSAMVDYCHTHPSVLIWSLANESHFNKLFEVSARLVHNLDKSRPTTFNNPDPKALCDLANLHYAGMPYDQHLQGDPRPILFGEYAFPVCHEQTDARIDPGVRELWGAGHADPDSEWGRQCARVFDSPMYMMPGIPSGTWDYILKSDRVIGGDIWAAFDEPFYLPDGKSVGYAWHHGFWGLIDGWRRPKPEWWLAKMIYSPVRFPDRQVAFEPGRREVRVPVQNRYSFTDLDELGFSWRLRDADGKLNAQLPPWSDGELTVPLPRDAKPGDELLIRVKDKADELITVAAITLGERRHRAIPAPTAGPPHWNRDGDTILVEGESFALKLNTRTGTIRPAGGKPCAVRGLPMPHITRFDFGDLGGPGAKPYEVLPHADTRAIESVDVREVGGAIEITATDRYDGLAGAMRWTIDRAGMGRIAYDYIFDGEDAPAREVGIRVPVGPDCDELSWDRWSEWGAYPEDSISRTRGTARAHRDPKYGPDVHGVRPTWPWALDETEMGTNDFRGVKLNVYEAALCAQDGAGIRLHADADAHVRAALDGDVTWLHILKTCRLGPVVVHGGEHVAGEFALELVR